MAEKSRGQKIVDGIGSFLCMILAVVMIIIGGALVMMGASYIYDKVTDFDPYEEYDPEDIPERSDGRFEIVITYVGAVILAGGIAMPVSIISKARKKRHAEHDNGGEE